jgi:hypothetical protein
MRIAWRDGVVAAALAAPMVPALWVTYGHSDDYPRLLVHILGQKPLLQTHLALGGRPLAAVMTSAGFGWAGQVADLAWLRLLGLLGWLLWASSIHALLRHHRLPTLPRLALTAALSLTPALLVFVGWASTFSYTWGATAALWGGIWTQRGLAKFSRGLSPHGTWLAFGGGGLLVFVSLLIYQPVAAWFFLPFLTAALCGDRPLHLGDWLAAGGYALVLLLYRGRFAVYTGWLAADPLVAGRASTAAVFWQKGELLLHGVLPDITAGWLVFWRPEAGWVIAALAGAGLWLAADGKVRRCANLTCFALIALGFALVPLLLSTENLQGFRLQGPAQGLVWVCLIGWWRPDTTPQRRIAASIVAVATGIVSLAAYPALHLGIAQPQHREWQAHLAAPPALDTYWDAPYFVYRVPLRRRHATVWARHEFGLVSSSLGWVPGSMVPMALVERAVLPAEDRRLALQMNKIVPFPAWQPYPQYVPMIDGGLLAIGRAMPPPRAFDTATWSTPPPLNRDLPGLGPAAILLEGWFYQPDRGPFIWRDGQIRHQPTARPEPE